MLIPPHPLLMKYKDSYQFNEVFFRFDFEVIQPHTFHFQAGHYVSLKVAANGLRRSYSIASDPTVQHAVSIVVDISPGGVGSQFLAGLTYGQEVEALGPLGKFIVSPDDGAQELVFVATGSGIAPFLAMITDQLYTQHNTKPITLYWGMRYEADLFWLKEFEDLAEKHTNFSFYPVLSRASDMWSLSRGYVTDVLEIHQFSEPTAFYVCGSQKNIQSISAMLMERKAVDKKYIYFEKFF